MPSTPASIEEHSISDLIDKVAGEKNRLIVVREGKEIAAVVPLEDLEILEELDDLLERNDIDAARKEAQEKGTIALEEVKARLGL
jgi:prevent-host-death family protein